MKENLFFCILCIFTLIIGHLYYNKGSIYINHDVWPLIVLKTGFGVSIYYAIMLLLCSIGITTKYNMTLIFKILIILLV